METTRKVGIASPLVGLPLLAAISCAETPASPAPATLVSVSAVQPAHEPIRPEVPERPALPPTPTLEEWRAQTSTEYVKSTKIVDGDIHVWHAPCPSGRPAIWVVPIILSDLLAGSHLYLNSDVTPGKSVHPNYLTDEGRERFAAVPEDRSLMELMITSPECP